VGGAFGVNLLAVLLQRRTIFHGDHLAAEMTESNPQFLYQHAMQSQALEAGGMPPLTAFTSSFEAIGGQIAMQATILAFRDCFFVIAVWFVIILSAIAFMPKPQLQMAQSR
jgi:hypothetical protein